MPEISVSNAAAFTRENRGKRWCSTPPIRTAVQPEQIENTRTVLIKARCSVVSKGRSIARTAYASPPTKGGERACVRATVEVSCERLERGDSIDRRSRTSDHRAAFRRTKSAIANGGQRAIVRWIAARFVASFMKAGAFGSQPWRRMHSEAGSGE